MWHMDYKVFVAIVGPGDKTFGLVVAGVDLVAARIDLIDIKVGFVATAMVFGKAFALHKVLLMPRKLLYQHWGITTRSGP